MDENGDTMKNCKICLCETCEKRITLECDNCLMCVGTPNQRAIQICSDYPVAKGHRADIPVLDYAIDDSFIEDLQKIFGEINEE